MAVGMVAARASMVSVPLRGLVVFNEGTRFARVSELQVSVPLRGLVVFNLRKIKSPDESLKVSVPLRGLVVFNWTEWR